LFFVPNFGILYLEFRKIPIGGEKFWRFLCLRAAKPPAGKPPLPLALRTNRKK